MNASPCDDPASCRVLYCQHEQRIADTLGKSRQRSDRIKQVGRSVRSAPGTFHSDPARLSDFGRAPRNAFTNAFADVTERDHPSRNDAMTWDRTTIPGSSSPTPMFSDNRARPI